MSLALVVLLAAPFNFRVFADEPDEGVDFEVVSIERDALIGILLQLNRL